jgi:hypothetical protein
MDIDADVEVLGEDGPPSVDLSSPIDVSKMLNAGVKT